MYRLWQATTKVASTADPGRRLCHGVRTAWRVLLVGGGTLALATGAAASGTRTARSPLPSLSCGPVSSSGSFRYLIASDLPLGGANRAQTIEMSKAIELVLREHDFRAGSYRLGYQSCDDANRQTGTWDPSAAPPTRTPTPPTPTCSV